MVVKMIYCLYFDLTRDIRSNKPLRLQDFPRASPSGTPSGEGVYLTVYPSSRPNTDTKQLHMCILVAITLRSVKESNSSNGASFLAEGIEYFNQSHQIRACISHT